MATSQDPISLPPDLAAFVQTEIDSGRYETASDVVSDALRLLERRKQQLRDAIEEGWQQAERGETVDAEVVFSEIRRKSEAARVAKGGR